MAGHRLRPLGLFTLLLSVTCGTAWYTNDRPYPTSAYPTREDTTYWYPETTGYPTREDTTYWYPRTTAYPTREDTTYEYPTTAYPTREDTTHGYATTVYPTPDWTTNDRYTTADDWNTTPGDRYTTPDDRYTTPDDRYTTPDDQYTSQEPPTSEPPNGTVSRPRCPQGWSLYRDNCYTYVNGSSLQRTTSWLQSDRLCRAMALGAGLASIHDYSENSFLANLAPGNEFYIWTGLFYDRTVLPGRYAYKWQDGTYLDFSYWKRGYPTHNPDEGCVYMDVWYEYGQWGHTHCNTLLSFFCKAPSTREYLDVERDNYGCDPGFEGYGDNCYKFLPDLYLDKDDFSCYQYYESDDLNIKSADENDFVHERMNNNSRHQSPDAFRLVGLNYDVETGFYWNDYYNPDAPYHNFAVEDMLTPMAHGDPKVYMDLSNGDWFISDTPARPMGAACKKARRKQA